MKLLFTVFLSLSLVLAHAQKPVSCGFGLTSGFSNAYAYSFDASLKNGAESMREMDKPIASVGITGFMDYKWNDEYNLGFRLGATNRGYRNDFVGFLFEDDIDPTQSTIPDVNKFILRYNYLSVNFRGTVKNIVGDRFYTWIGLGPDILLSRQEVRFKYSNDLLVEKSEVEWGPGTEVRHINVALDIGMGIDVLTMKSSTVFLEPSLYLSGLSLFKNSEVKRNLYGADLTLGLRFNSKKSD